MKATSRATIGVVIPTFNRPQYLRQSVDCVLDQSRVPDELIIANNGDASVEPHLPNHHALRIVDLEPRAGAAHARNVGVEAASSDYIAFLDDDDLWEPKYLERVEEILESERPDYIIARLDRLSNGSIRPYRAIRDTEGLIADVLVTNPGVGGPNSIVRREAFLEVGGYDRHLVTSEDRALVLEFLLARRKVVAAPHIQSIARQHSGDRLTSYATMAMGKQSFLEKYRHLMSRSAIYRNEAVIQYCHLRHRPGPLHLLRLSGLGALSVTWGLLERMGFDGN